MWQEEKKKNIALLSAVWLQASMHRSSMLVAGGTSCPSVDCIGKQSPTY
jgi:hypothetical protein